MNEAEAAPGADTRTFYIVVHVLADNAFKKYLQHCSQSDLMLFRGMLLRVGAGWQLPTRSAAGACLCSSQQHDCKASWYVAITHSAWSLVVGTSHSTCNPLAYV